VIIPCGKGHIKYLDELFKALSEQTYSGKWEIILVVEECKEAKEVVNKIKYYNELDIKVKFSDIKNPAANRNIGIKEAKGEIIAFIDSDCIPYNNWLENLITPLKEYDGAQGIDFSYNQTVIGKVQEEEQLLCLKYNLVEGCRYKFIDTKNFAIKSDILKKVGLFDERLVTAEDRDLGYRLFKNNFYIIQNNSAVVLHRYDEGSILNFFRRGEWYGTGDFLFNEKWFKQSSSKKLKDILKSLKASKNYFIKIFRSPREKRMVYLLFSAREIGRTYGKIKTLLSYKKIKTLWMH